jgi:transcription initiation factor TFIID subunit 5
MASNVPNVPSRSGSITNGPPSAGINQPPPTPGGVASNQNLNNIVIEYLAKKGYTKTENALRREEIEMRDPRRPVRAEQDPASKYQKAYTLLESFVDDALQAYRPELIRLLWPIFVHSLLNLAADFYPRQYDEFYKAHHEAFEREHSDELRQLLPLNLPEHLESSNVAKIYRSNKYRLTISNMAYSVLLQFLETNERDGGSVIISLLNTHFQLVSLDRAAAGPEHSLAALLARRGEEWEFPAEDEGIPGHNPGQSNTDPNAPKILTKLALGPLPPDNDLMEDVQSELKEEDAKNPPGPGEQSLLDAFEEKIKKEPTEDAPSRDAVPLPPPLARDVAMEVQKIHEHRDRFKVDPRTSGVPPGISVCMYTFHNSFDRYVATPLL